MTTMKEQAQAEAEIWSQVPWESRTKSHGMSKYFQDTFGDSSRAVGARFQLLRAGDVTDPLWRRLDADMTIATAIRIFRKAVVRGRSGEDLGEAILREIEAYDSNGFVAMLPDGKTIRKKGFGGKIPKTGEPGETREPPAPEDGPSVSAGPDPVEDPPVEEAQDPPRPRGPGEGREEYWEKIRTMTRAYVNERLSTTPSTIRDELVTDMEMEMRAALGRIQARVRRLEREARSSAPHRIRKEVLEWCRVLHLGPPGVGKPVDEKELKSRYRKLAREYHPDKTGGDEAMTAVFRSVDEAFLGLTSYNEQFARKD
jgi:hypothetical protein